MSSRKWSVSVGSALLALAASASLSNANVSLATYSLVNSSLTPSNVNANITASNVTLGSNAHDNNSSLGFQFQDLFPRTTEAALAADTYFRFTITPAAGQALDLTSLTFFGDPNGGGDQSYVRSSLDSYTSDLFTGNYPYAGATQTVSLGSDFSSITSPISFEFIDNGNASYSNIQVNGTVTAVPDPATLSLMGTGAVALLGRRRRKA